jgi:branched-chain amino acid aminotransferase
MKPTRWIWHNGAMVPWEQATVHVLTHGLHYGSSVFEGMRAYATPRGTAIFRGRDHLRRLFDSARIYRMQVPFNVEQISQACRSVVRENGLSAAYIRSIIYRGYGSLQLVPGDACPIEVSVAAIEWGKYLGAEAVDAAVSSWTRPAPNTLPALAKAGGNYLSSQLITMEAQRHGYAEGIGLDSGGRVSEGAGENLFLVRDEVIYTPPAAASILAGITRDSVIAPARQRGYEVREEPIPREALYTADELFFTGTATEVCAIRSVDGLPVRGGPVTDDLKRAFFGLFTGETEDRWGWLEVI